MSSIQDINNSDKENKKLTKKKIESQLDLVLKGHKINQNELRKDFNQLINQNRFLSLQNQQLLDLNQELKQQLATLNKELIRLKEERNYKALLKKKRANQNRLPKRDPITSEIYNLLIKEISGLNYIATRTRIAICLLTVMGIRISELLPLKVNQLETLLTEGWISIDRLKRGPSNHKAFLTSEGKKIIKARKRDFEFLFLMKKKDSYVFTSEREPNKVLRRETITINVNQVMQKASKHMSPQPNITSHSFRIGYISQLWKDTKDINS